MNNTPKTVGFVSLGCPKALVDSEQIISQLRTEGYQISPSYDDADLVIVNTCGFINDAVEESLDAIGEALAENGKVIVTGCLGAKGNVVLENHPQVLAITGPHARDEVMAAVHKHLPPQHTLDDLPPRQDIKLTPQHYAYLKISEGCNHSCSFCIIPSLRGDLISRPIGEVLQEAENLVNAGVKELLVISQDTGAYGIDTKYRTGFWNGRPIKTRMTALAQALGDLDVWVRMHYVYPYPHVDELIPLMADGKILPYLDIPFQHASPTILKKMKRPGNINNVLERITQWRQDCPDIVLRSTFIVGFPGETEQDFEQLLDFIQTAQLDRVGAFAYSPVEGAAANTLPNPIPTDLQQERLERFMTLQEKISQQKLQNRIGQSLTVLIDSIDENNATGRCYADAPDIDGNVYVSGINSSLRPGELIKVTITDSDSHDLWGKTLS